MLVKQQGPSHLSLCPQGAHSLVGTDPPCKSDDLKWAELGWKSPLDAWPGLGFRKGFLAEETSELEPEGWGEPHQTTQGQGWCRGRGRNIYKGQTVKRNTCFFPYKFGCLKFAFQDLKFLICWCLVNLLQIVDSKSVGLHGYQVLSCHLSHFIPMLWRENDFPRFIEEKTEVNCWDRTWVCARGRTDLLRCGFPELVSVSCHYLVPKHCDIS